MLYDILCPVPVTYDAINSPGTGVLFKKNHSVSLAPIEAFTRESKKLSALLFFQFIYTKVGVEQVRHFST
jgi:hypothetical protein